MQLSESISRISVSPTAAVVMKADKLKSSGINLVDFGAGEPDFPTPENIKRAGIEASVRAVDAVQFDQRRLGFEFDMIQNRWDQSLSPGNEQSFYWGSEAADNQGTRNYMGAKDPAIDAVIAAMLEAREHPAFVSAVRALDRVLMSGFYAIPLFNVREQWIARWNRIERPAATALTGYLPETWWQKPESQAK